MPTQHVTQAIGGSLPCRSLVYIDSSHSHSETSCQLRRQKDAMIGRHRDSECEFPCTYTACISHISQVKPTLGGFPKDPGFGAITSSGGFTDMDTNHQSVCRLRYGGPVSQIVGSESAGFLGLSILWYHQDRPLKILIYYIWLYMSLSLWWTGKLPTKKNKRMFFL